MSAMTTGTATLVRLDDTTVGTPGDSGWVTPSGRRYTCEVHLYREDEGGYSVNVPALPGVVSQGETDREAVENITEALKGAIAQYLADIGRVPWLNPPREPRDGVIVRWAFPHVE